ncbi:MAG: C1 family peptidase [Planctomycetaceae bacterium]|nr:C1 family peptidase [Planctomycetaceae bacterium]
MNSFTTLQTGWIPDIRDPRDWTIEKPEVIGSVGNLQLSHRRTPPPQVDLREDADGVYFTSPGNQSPLNCSSVFSCLSLIEYFERRGLGNTFEPSALFVYKMARKLRGLTGDSGVDLRSTLKAIVRYGVPPYHFWPYDPEKFDKGPCDMSLLGYAREFAHVQYFRLDRRNSNGETLLETVKSFLAARFPIAFGFPVPYSLHRGPEIPYRPTFDGIRGGQAVVAVGYDDNHPSTTGGALLIRSSWGHDWGENGYGWLPYSYLLSQLATDFWTVIRPDWLDSGEFLRPSIMSHPKQTIPSHP